MTRTRSKVVRTNSTYAEPGKMMARAVAIEMAREWEAETILDLWGGGESARAFRDAMPHAAIVSAEIDKTLWPALVQDAQLHGYAYHLGDLLDAPGTYDFVWLDLCGQASKGLGELLRSARRLVNKDGILLLTIMPARETDVVISGEMRERLLPMWIEKMAGCSISFLLPYQRARGQSMWLVGMQPGRGSLFYHDESYRVFVQEELTESGYFNWLMKDAGPHPHMPDMRRTTPIFGVEDVIDQHRLAALEPAH